MGTQEETQLAMAYRAVYKGAYDIDGRATTTRRVRNTFCEHRHSCRATQPSARYRQTDAPEINPPPEQTRVVCSYRRSFYLTESYTQEDVPGCGKPDEVVTYEESLHFSSKIVHSPCHTREGPIQTIPIQGPITSHAAITHPTSPIITTYSRRRGVRG